MERDTTSREAKSLAEGAYRSMNRSPCISHSKKHFESNKFFWILPRPTKAQINTKQNNTKQIKKIKNPLHICSIRTITHLRVTEDTALTTSALGNETASAVDASRVELNEF
jgi:hypothetical protein